MPIIYYVGTRVSSSFCSIIKHLNPFITKDQFHSTIIYSRSWFPYKESKTCPLNIDPLTFKLGILGNVAVLHFYSKELVERHEELKKLGATSDFDTFKPHITIAPAHYFDSIKIPSIELILTREYYRTWEEPSAI